MSNKVDLECGDILIKRAQNGWIAIECSYYDDEPDKTYLSSMVFEDENKSCGDSHSLNELFKSMFEIYFRQKYKGGIETSIKEKGYRED